MIVSFQEPGKKAARFVAQQNLESLSCFFVFVFVFVFCFDFFLPIFSSSSLTLPKNYELCKFARDQSGQSRAGKRDPSSSLGNQSEHFAKKISFPFLKVVLRKKLISKLFIPFTQNITSTRNFLCGRIGKLTSV